MSYPPIRLIRGLGLMIFMMMGIVLGAALSLNARPSGPDKLVGQPADIASSAYQYRADRKADENPPESWLALMRYAGQPLNKPVDVNAPAIKTGPCADCSGRRSAR